MSTDDDEEEELDVLIPENVEHVLGLIRAAAAPTLQGDLYVSNGEAHRLRDRLFVAVLQAIADGAPEPVALARAALRAQTIPMAYWFE